MTTPYQGESPYPGLYGLQQPFILGSPGLGNPGLEQQNKSSFLHKLLVGGIVIGGIAGGGFALKKFSPEYYEKIASTIVTVTPDFVKNGISTIGTKAKNVLGIKTAEEAATGIGGKIKSALSTIVTAPFKFVKNLFSSAKPA